MSISHRFRPIAVAAALLAGTNLAQAADYLITFGDSYSQTGFNVSAAKPSAANPIGNPPYPGWTTSGGPNWIGYLLEDYSASTLLSYNFAYGGATVNASLVKPYQPTVKSLIDQVKQFSDSIAPKPSYAPWNAENSLFAIWMGVNDVGNSFWLENVTELHGKIMQDYFEEVEVLYQAGARNFAFLNVPPINKSPMMLAQPEESRELEATVIAKFNQLLVDHANAFASSHQGVKIVVVDTQAPFDAAIADPAKYGSKDATCFNSDGKTCLWFNDYHPGTAIHGLVAEAVARTWNGSIFREIN
ncbi:carbohydrate esterase family 16 protein [Westerdykella ornata]|uniref:Carbohydrate esterase family 16 protein n=1 Tax=Westerdykella ornata TaxID=318751 RepID=A0A6A6JC81_WESOR|nr:carbohydrate esterase family 16 protein [Westerdykella ornata]KAF2273783.1 carbohydrate esterase family 16 protein [Westerdykella ornata]